MPISVTVRSKAWLYGRSLAGIVGSNPAGGMDVCVECCVLSGRGLCDGLITCPEKSYRLWCVVVGDLETSRMRRPWPALGRSATGKEIIRKFVFKKSPVVNPTGFALTIPLHSVPLPLLINYVKPTCCNIKRFTFFPTRCIYVLLTVLTINTYDFPSTKRLDSLLEKEFTLC